MKDVNFADLTTEEIEELAAEALNELTLYQRVQVVLKVFNEDDRDELSMWISEGKKPEPEADAAPVEGVPSASGTDSTG